MHKCYHEVISCWTAWLLGIKILLILVQFNLWINIWECWYNFTDRKVCRLKGFFTKCYGFGEYSIWSYTEVVTYRIFARKPNFILKIKMISKENAIFMGFKTIFIAIYSAKWWLLKSRLWLSFFYYVAYSTFNWWFVTSNAGNNRKTTTLNFNYH